MLIISLSSTGEGSRSRAVFWRRIRLFFPLLAVASCGRGLTQLGGFSGSLDPSFADRGTLVYSVSVGSDYPTAIATHPSGSFFVAGNYVEGGNFFPHVRKFTASGSPDPSFSPVDRTTLSSVITGASFPVRIVPLTDGKLLVGGICSGCLGQGGAPFVLRLTETGALDTTFGESGIRVFVIPGFAYGEGTDVQVGHPELGPIWVSGMVSNGSSTARWMVGRLNFDGSLDLTFGEADTGYQTYEISAGDDLAPLLLLRADGGAFVGGTTYAGAGADNETGDFALISVLPDGTRDMSFGSSGKAVLAFPDGRTDTTLGVHLTSDGLILQSGKCKSSTFDKVCFARWTTSGAADTSFGSNGFLLKSYEQDLALGGPILDFAGRLVFPGAFPTPGGSLMAVTRFFTDGAVDTSFGTAGIASLSGVFFGTPSAAAIDLSGRVYVAGYYFTPTSTLDTLVVRFLP